jgi:hypothetical protein
MTEKDFEDIICKYPELIEEGLILDGRQVRLYGRRIDILFKDRFQRKLIVELIAGPIKDGHIGHMLSYEGLLLTVDDPSLRVMLVGTSVPPNIQKSLDYHSIAWKEITFSSLKGFLQAKQDESFSFLFEEELPVKTDIIIQQNFKLIENTNFVAVKDVIIKPEILVSRLKASENYKSFQSILFLKKGNEEKAKEILEKNIGKLNHEHLKEVLKLVDEPYPYTDNGKIVKRPWFVNLLNKPNTQSLFSENVEKINEWFSELRNEKLPINKRIDNLLDDRYKIKGISIGFITLMLYLLDKENNLIWFRPQHNGLKIMYPEIEEFKPSGPNYLLFNEAAKKFAKKFDFEHSELDWIFSVGLKNT